MKTKYKHATFELMPGRWYCYNEKGKFLGQIYYDNCQQSIMWVQSENVRCSIDCLKDIIAFTKQL